ncbi:uncharacterized protein BXZ73DRAFT_41161 [Epithele typhae]|uniref:uncharacterized protein n=1 Tax=Epithele typhae TaxID=378194 RepID=UPI0020074744|nr:uncharacterized protein BXZ73DRAFT_41161 [Epithele typhae]KAH9942145.1 hypothetical protein BXZ73DRAFT_41161 [Epithele typhae]
MSTPTVPTGLLYVFTETGPNVTNAEFTDWYDNEHVPLRTPLPFFHNATRWVATDDKQPTYLATYDLTSCAALDEPAYTALPANRSARERDVMGRMALVARRTYDALPPPPPSSASAPSPIPGFTPLTLPAHARSAGAGNECRADYDPLTPGPFLIAVEIAVPAEREAELARWYADEHLPLLAAVPGWRRSRRFVLREVSAPTGARAAPGELVPGAEGTPRLLALHEYASMDGFGSEEFKRASTTEWRKRMFGMATAWERRVFKVMRTWVGEGSKA